MNINGVAFHEAGHAVVAWFVGLSPIRATVIPADDYLGCVGRPPAFGAGDDPQYDQKPGDQERAMLSAMVALAGTIAQRRSGYGRVLHAHGRGDRLHAVALAELFCETDDEARTWVKLCQIRTERVIDLLWPLVESIADRLSRMQELDAHQIAETIQSGVNALGKLPKDRTCFGDIWET